MVCCGYAPSGQIVASLLDDSLGLLLKVWFGFILSTTDFRPAARSPLVTIQHFEPALQLVADSALALWWSGLAAG
jgi:hypothetical protein